MPLTSKMSRKWTDRYALIVLSGLLPVVLGVLIIVWQANRSLKLEATQTAQEAVRQFDLMLENAMLAADVVLPLAGQIRTAIEQVVVDAKFDAGVVTRTGVEVIAVAVATGDEIESRHERSAPPFQIELCRLGIFDGGA